MGNEVRAEGYRSSGSGSQLASLETPGPSPEAEPPSPQPESGSGEAGESGGQLTSLPQCVTPSITIWM